MIRALLTLFLAMFFAAIGNIFFSRGMKKIGALDRYHPKDVALFFGKAMINSSIWFGILTSTLYFFLWLVVLSWSDVSWALPMNAVEYVFVAAGGALFLKEKIDWNRAIGIGLISLGVVFLMQSWG